jgi:hypothetical protein
VSSEHFSVGRRADRRLGLDEELPAEGQLERAALARAQRERNFRNENRSNETHASTTDPDARLYRKADGRGSRLCFMGHVLMENRNGLAGGAALTRATGTAEREAALTLLDRRQTDRRITLGAEKAYDLLTCFALVK